MSGSSLKPLRGSIQLVSSVVRPIRNASHANIKKNWPCVIKELGDVVFLKYSV